MNTKIFFEKILTDKELEIRNQRKEEFDKTLKNNYKETFIKSIERAANRKFKSDKIKKIELDSNLNLLTNINIYDHDDNLIHDKKIEDQITKFYLAKKKASDSNSDRYYSEKKKKPNMKENLLNRSLGEESYFNY